MASSTRRDYETICGFRQGAHYRKMDLHTHTPASECSSFTLPRVIEAVFPPKPGSATRVWRDACLKLVRDLAAGTSRFAEAYGDAELTARPRLGDRAPLDPEALRFIAQGWLDDAAAVCPLDEPKPTTAQRDERDRLVGRAIYDLRNYLASRFFPEEFVLRCYIEGLHLVALTDHNHPGTIVPRAEQLGTWFSALEAVNEHYVRDIRKGDPPGARVRATLVARLELAQRRLATTFDETSKASATTKKQHKDRAKKLRSLEARQAHVAERLAHWRKPDSLPEALTLLPGTEITVSDVHLLCLFPPQWYVPGRIGAILRAIGIPEDHWGRGFLAAASASVQDTITLVDEEGGIAVPAHANTSHKGLLRLFTKGLALTKVLEHPALLALETTGGTVLAGDTRRDACETLRWLEEGRARPERTRRMCFVKSSDAHECRIELNGTGEDLGARFSHVKLDIRPNDTPEEVFRTLRLALLSGHSRVLECPAEDGYNYAAAKDYRVAKAARTRLLDCDRRRPTLIGMTVGGAGSYADGLQVRFNPYLNCIVGSGGKSVLVRLVAYAFGAYAFRRGTRRAWLPGQVRVFWRDGDDVHCIERTGKSSKPDGPNVAARWLRREADGSWGVLHETPDPALGTLPAMVEMWPPQEVQDGKHDLEGFEDALIDELVSRLEYRPGEERKPLLVVQPRDIFNSHRLFAAVLAKPLLKARQIIWSTGSPNVPTALDAEKIIVTREKGGGRQMEVVYGGDLHEDEIRDEFVNEFEGGWPAFVRRVALYS